MAMLYAASIVCWAAAARYFGLWAAIAVSAALLLYQGYAIDVPRALERAGVRRGIRGLGSARPVSRLRTIDRPLRARRVSALRWSHSCVLEMRSCSSSRSFRFSSRARPRTRLERTGAFVLAAILPLLAWSVHNGVRFDSWGIARGGNAIIPFYRAFITDHIISPSNGEQSRRLAAAMQRHLLTREPYRSYGVTLDQLFEKGSFRVHEDLYLLSDEVFGWDTDYDVLRGAGIEGVRAHPGIYARGVARTVWDELSKAQFRAVSSTPPSAGSDGSPHATVVIRRKRLPAPSEGEPIPSGQVVWISRPDNSIRQVWTSPTEWHFEFARASERPRFERIGRRTRSSSTRSPSAPETRSSRCASTSCRAGSRGLDVDPRRPRRHWGAPPRGWPTLARPRRWLPSRWCC